MPADVAVVGAGAAGLTAAIRAAEAGARVALFNSHPRVGLKILMSGGTRCNVTHASVEPTAFNGGSRHAIALVLRAFPAAAARAWFETLGVPLTEEPGGKLFPVSNSARTVLEALVGRARGLGVRTLSGVKVTAARPGFALQTTAGPFEAPAVVLTTGGLSYPATGSDGSGYDLARSLGHTVELLTPALTPLVLAGDRHLRLQGVGVPAELTLWVDGRRCASSPGPMLFTHFGLSGPAALDFSRHWLRAGEGVRTVTADFGVRESDWQSARPAHPTGTIQSWLSERLPVSLVRELARAAGLPAGRALSQVTREERRRLLEVLTRLPLEVTGTLGYRKAEVTAGGVPLGEIDPRRMASRVCPGLFLAGEILDVDGRLGGYNFQWAWSSGRVAGESAAAFALAHRPALP